MEDIKPEILGKSEFDYRETFKSKVSSEFSDSQDPASRRRNNDFLAEYSSTSAVFSVDVSMEESELVMAEI